MKTLKLKNYFLIGVGQVLSIQAWLEGLMLHGKESRNRTRFIRLLIARVQEINEIKNEMLARHSEKDKEGKTIYLVGTMTENKKGHQEYKDEETTDSTPAQNKRYKIKDNAEFNKEWEEYVNGELIIDVVPSVVDAIYGVRDLVLNTKEEFSGHNAVLYDEWCQAFEDIKVSEEK